MLALYLSFLRLRPSRFAEYIDRRLDLLIAANSVTVSLNSAVGQLDTYSVMWVELQLQVCMYLSGIE